MSKIVLIQNGDVVTSCKQSRTDIAHSMWEISKVMDGVNPAMFLEMHCMIKYTLDTKNLRLKIEQNGNEEEP